MGGIRLQQLRTDGIAFYLAWSFGVDNNMLAAGEWKDWIGRLQLR